MRQNNRGFTLIEVLVVVAIIALLISILLPSLQRAREETRNTLCKSSLKQLMTGQALYITEYRVLPATHTLLYKNETLHGIPWWGALAGDTWDGAASVVYSPNAYQSPQFRQDVPVKGTLFKYVKDAKVYVCPSDNPGPAIELDPAGGGGNGRLSYSMNAYIAFKKPEQLTTYIPIKDLANQELPGGRDRRSFKRGERIVIGDSRMMVMFEEHPYYHMNRGNAEGNFNVTDRIVTRHSPVRRNDTSPDNKARTNIGFLDSHVESRMYPVRTEAAQLFTEMGLPFSDEDSEIMRAYIPKMPPPLAPR